MRFYLALFYLILTGCATTSTGVTEYDLDSSYRHGQYEYVIKHMEKKLASGELKNKDRLLHILNLAMVYQASGDYQKSNNLFLEAKRKYIAWNDYISLSEETKSFILGDDNKRFTLEDHEQLLVQVYITLNFIYLGNYESALVEIRSLDQSLYQFKNFHPEFNLKDVFYVSYLSGMMYEAQKKYDEAYIDYKRVYELNPNFSYLGYDLWRTSYLSQRFDESKKWKEKYKISSKYENYIKTGIYQKQGEIILVFQNGKAPFKTAHPSWAGVPMYQGRLSGTEEAQVRLDGEEYGVTQNFFHIENLVVDLYQSRYKKYLSRDIARTVVKSAALLPLTLATGFVGGVAINTAVNSSNDLDLRSWEYLPRDIQIMRVMALPGSHEIYLTYNSARGDFEKREVQVKSGQKTWMPFKYADSY